MSNVWWPKRANLKIVSGIFLKKQKKYENFTFLKININNLFETK